MFLFGFSGNYNYTLFTASYSYSPALEVCFFSPVLDNGDYTLHIFGTVIRLVVYLRVSQRTVVAQGLQRAGADVEHPAHVLIVHPLTHSLFSMPLADGIHTADEMVELGNHLLKGLFFDRYDFHIVFLVVIVSFATKE